MKKSLVATSLSIAVLFSGCGYNLIPKYDKDTKTYSLNSYTIKNVEYYSAEDKSENQYVNLNMERVKANSSVCNEFNVRYHTVNEHGFFSNSAKNELDKIFQGRCKYDQIGETSLYKVQCPTKFATSEYDTTMNYGEYVYGIIQSVPFERGYKSNLYFTSANDECIKDIEKYILDDQK